MYSDLSENLNQLIIIPPYFASGYQTKKKIQNYFIFLPHTINQIMKKI